MGRTNVTENSQQEAMDKEQEIVKENDAREDSVNCGAVFLLKTEQFVFICGFCENSYPNMNDFGIHVRSNHIRDGKTDENSDKTEKQESMETVDIKDEPFTDEDEIQEMEFINPSDQPSGEDEQQETEPKNPPKRSSVGKDPNFYCTLCKKQYSKKHTFDKHNEQEHNQLRPCHFCDKPFSSLEERTQHEKSHFGETPYPCPYCPMQFRRKPIQLQHIRHVHEGIKAHQCSVCNRYFALRTTLRIHMLTHSLPGEYSCEICGRHFAFQCEKNYHMLRHTGEKPFQCEECGSRYVSQKQLTYHKKKHTGENVKCEICGKTFYSKVRLNAHAIVHSAVKRHKCPTCGQSFRKSDSLKQHQKLHTGLKEYSCNICGKEFAQAAGLYSHRKSHLQDS